MTDTPNQTAELSDEELEAIWECAERNAIHCVHVWTVVNPYPAGSREADAYSGAFRSAYARENGY